MKTVRSTLHATHLPNFQNESSTKTNNIKRQYRKNKIYQRQFSKTILIFYDDDKTLQLNDVTVRAVNEWIIHAGIDVYKQTNPQGILTRTYYYQDVQPRCFL